MRWLCHYVKDYVCAITHEMVVPLLRELVRYQLLLNLSVRSRTLIGMLQYSRPVESLFGHNEPRFPNLPLLPPLNVLGVRMGVMTTPPPFLAV